MLEKEGIGFLYLFGDLSMTDRVEVTKAFEEKEEARILIAGIKCGGVALNLTYANRVINVDPWWNHPVEQQAFGRVHRIGQKKQTYFVRLFAEGTIDERLINLQGEKLHQIDRGFGDDRPAERHTTDKLVSLLGTVVQDETGKIIRVERNKVVARATDLVAAVAENEQVTETAATEHGTKDPSDDVTEVPA